MTLADLFAKLNSSKVFYEEPPIITNEIISTSSINTGSNHEACKKESCEKEKETSVGDWYYGNEKKRRLAPPFKNFNH